MRYRHLSLLIMIVTTLAHVASAEIHRAKSATYKSSRSRASNAGSTVDVALAEMPNHEAAEDAMLFSHMEMAAGSRGVDVWIYSILGAILVGLSGIFPLLVIPLEAGPSLKHGAPANHLKLMLSFAVGSLLGDVFCHLLPEVWAYMDRDDHKAHIRIGLWVIGGLLFFLIVEKLAGDETEFERMEDTCDEICPSEQQSEPAKNPNVNQSSVKHRRSQQNSKKRSTVQDSASKHPNGKGHTSHKEKNSPSQSAKEDNTPHIKVSGYLNLFANVVDNFTHGLAVAGSFLISSRVGTLTTVAILLHEVPHEVGDFAILLRSGFDRWKAAKAQFLTATGGVFGALTALTAESAQLAGERTAWILPFTSGGFLYIALVTVVPDLLQERHAVESLKQIACLVLGVAVMVCVTVIFD